MDALTLAQQIADVVRQNGVRDDALVKRALATVPGILACNAAPSTIDGDDVRRALAIADEVIAVFEKHGITDWHNQNSLIELVRDVRRGGDIIRRRHADGSLTMAPSDDRGDPRGRS